MQQIRDFYIAHSAVVTGDVVLGAGVNIWYGCVLRGDVARLTLGARVNVQDGSIVHADYGEPQVIEDGVVIGHAAVLHGLRIGHDSLVGIGARLLAGSEVGEESIIASGAIVTERRRIPPRSLVMGIPGKVVRAVTEEEVERTRRINAHYLELAQQYVRGIFPAPWLRTNQT
jgi:carbonic anhydrase/acetyltransferase-like protein (isoleucine patch superfamily)